MDTKKLVFINPNSGRAKKGDELAKLTSVLAALPGVETKLLGKLDDPTALAKAAVKQGAKVIGAAGGDGTLNAIASGLVGTDVSFVALPFGTLNHFARDINMPTDLEKAAQYMLDGPEETIDVGQVNDRYFLNNSSLGIYPRLVSLREKREKELGKWRAYVWAAMQTARDPVRLRVSFQATASLPARNLKVGLIFVANNQCDTWLPKPGRRDCLTNHTLDVYVLEARNRLKLFSLAWHFLLNRLDNYPDILHSSETDFTINSRNRKVSVARDGEVGPMVSPIHYRSLSSALRVRMPPKEAK